MLLMQSNFKSQKKYIEHCDCNKRQAHTHTHTQTNRNRAVICTYYGRCRSYVRLNACTRCTTDSHPLFAIDFPTAENWLHQLRPKRQWRPLNKTTTCPGFIFYLIHIHSRRRHRSTTIGDDDERLVHTHTHFHCFRVHSQAYACWLLLAPTSSQYLIFVLIYSVITACMS